MKIDSEKKLKNCPSLFHIFSFNTGAWGENRRGFALKIQRLVF